MLSAHEQLHRFLDRRSTVFFEAMMNMAKSHYGHADGGQYAALKEMAYVIGRTMILADLNGRKRLLMEADRAAKFDEDKTPISGLPFEEAIEDLVSREPRLAKSYLEVSALYNTSYTFALARSADLNITKRIHAVAGELMGAGGSPFDFETIAKEITDFTKAYADNVFRTNTATAFNNGRFAQAQDKDVKQVIPAMRFTSLCLPTSRPWHVAADGMIAATDDVIWKTFHPPLGWQCYCSADFISKYELERRGLINEDGTVKRFLPASFGQAHPDVGFRPSTITFDEAA